MKSILLAAALFACAPIARAQDAPETDAAAARETQTAPAPSTLDEVQVKAATDLLIRTATHYNTLQTFEALIEREVPGGLTALTEHRVFRLQLDATGKFVLGQRDISADAKPGNWGKAIFDGQKVVDFGSVIPKNYNRRVPQFNK